MSNNSSVLAASAHFGIKVAPPGVAPGKAGKQPGDSHLEIGSVYGASQELGRTPKPAGKGLVSGFTSDPERERARESTGERVRGSTLQNRSPSLPDLWARCPDPPLGTGSWLSKEQAGQEMAAGPQLGAGKLAHRRLRRGGNLFWMWDPDGARGVGGEESEAR